MRPRKLSPLCKRGIEGDFGIRTMFESPLAPLFQRGDAPLYPDLRLMNYPGLNNFKIPRQLPIRHMLAELAFFPFAGRGIVFDEWVAKQFARNR